MKTLFKLRDWLTIDEAAKHLSVLFDEPVANAEILRLALDGELTLSVRFVNHAYAKRGRLTTKNDRLVEVPGLDGVKVEIRRGIDIDGERMIELGSEVENLTGVWDLPMIGAEELDVEHEYQMQTSGPSVELECLEGPFVSGNGIYWQIQEHFSKNEYFNQDHLHKPWNSPHNFYPAPGLPRDAVFVVRPNSLRDLIARVQVENKKYSPDAPHPASQPGTPHAEAQRTGGRPRSNRWPAWVAELVLYLHDNGFPSGEGAAGQDSLIAAVEERLIQLGSEAPSRTTVQDTVRAVLVRYRAARN